MALLREGERIVDAGEALAFIGERAGKEEKTAIDLWAKKGKGGTKVTKTFGNHTLKFGTDYRLIRYNSESQGTSAAGSFTFNSTFTQADPFTASSSNTSGTA